MALQSMPRSVTWTALRGAAALLMVSPQATPMRRRPKSKARTTRPRASGMSGGETDPRAVHAQQLPGCLPAIFERQFEHDALVDRQAQPRVFEHFALELSGVPAGVAQRYEGAMRALAARNRRQHVARSGDLNVIGDAVSRIPETARPVQYEAAVGVHRAATQDRLLADTD